jgi:hypothetical protein
LRHDLGGLARTRERAGDNRIKTQVQFSDGCRNAFHLFDTWVGERTRGIIALPFASFTGESMSQKV